ncbi:MAG: aminoacyl-tRNA hydrolase [Myxococcales bacterium]|nr:aminoacyl-tRNA hydrolase [Myxococcales bacterium]MCB9548842.1 aminoacyl-tRNA hydrolase [Myxococcales bacterium]
MEDRCLVVGLGNPGPRYAGNRHNVGFMVVDRLADGAGLPLSRTRFSGRYAAGNLEGKPAALLEPDTFMNLSGKSVSAARSFFNVEVGNILVIHDELDLPFGTIRLKVGGGHAGHNGLRSIVAQLGTADFVRLRVGIGRPQHGAVSDFVLADFSREEREWLPDLLDRGVDAVRLALRDGPRMAMNVINVAR